MSQISARDLLAKVLVFANTAVAADENGQIDIAVRNYERAIAMSKGEAIVSELNELQKSKFEERIKLYKGRVKVLSSFLDPDYEAMIMPERGVLEDAPSAQCMRPFWVMRTLMPTMEYGSWIGPDLYIPRFAWVQEGAKLEMISLKYECTETLIQPLSKLKQFNMKDQSTWKEVGELLTALSAFLYRTQSELSKKLKFIPTPEPNKTVTTTLSRFMGAKKERLDYSTDYFDKVFKLFEVCQIVPSWLDYFVGDEINTATASSMYNVTTDKDLIRFHLLNLSEFFHIVFCPFFMKDLHKLIDRYLRNGLKGFTQVTDSRLAVQIIDEMSVS